MSKDRDPGRFPTRREVIFGFAVSFTTAAVGLIGFRNGWIDPRQSASATGQEPEPGQPIYVSLPDWNCKQSNQLGIKDRGSLDFTRPQTSVTAEILSITYPAKRGDEDFYETILYENQGLQSGQILRYYSEGNEECPLPYEGAPIISAANQ